jgi:hypothetical protein
LIEKCEAEDVKACQAAMLAKFGEWIEIYGNAFPS